MDLESVWAQREQDKYPKLFGPLSRGIFPLSINTFKPFGIEAIKHDPRWFTHGVLEYGPTENRKSWVYVTSGYSNPWELDPSEYSRSEESGSGVEFCLECFEQGNWAILLLQFILAFDIVLSSNLYGNGQPFGLHDRLPMGQSINGEDNCLVKNIIFFEPTNFPIEFTLASGKVKFMQIVGVTDNELKIAKTKGFEKIIEELKGIDAFPITSTSRI